MRENNIIVTYSLSKGRDPGETRLPGVTAQPSPRR
jgi:hypothetical protein